VVPIHVDAWRLDLSPLPRTFLPFDIRAKPVWPLLSSLQSSETCKLRDCSFAAPLNSFLESPVYRDEYDKSLIGVARQSVPID
jgi:hypothetical protein